MRTQRCPVRSRLVPAASIAGEVGFGQRRAVDDRLPVDERLLAEMSLAIVGRRLTRGAADGGLDGDELLGAEQLDAQPGELGRGAVDEVVGLLEVELDQRRLVVGGELGHAR